MKFCWREINLKAKFNVKLRAMKIGELAGRTGLAASRIRFYERIGLLKAVERQANGYRSYHLIARLEAPLEDVKGNNPGHFFVEIQLRTIAMDSWASLEHQMKYKKNIKNPEMITRELKRCADELASCDLSMQTIRNLIRQEH